MTPTSEKSQMLAAIDVGTNSVHMVIATPTDGSSPQIVTRERMRVRLGAGGDDMRHLHPDAIDRAIGALVECRRIANSYDAEVVAVATSAVREANNAADFLSRARHEAGVVVEVISGVEEAHLIHLGALSAVTMRDRKHLVIDIGGGSTELIAATHTDVALACSVKLGHIRLTDRFFAGGVIEPGAIRACRQHIKSVITPLAHDIKEIGFELAVGCSGTIASLAELCAQDRSQPLLTIANALIKRPELDRWVALLISCHTPEERDRITGLGPGRRDVIVAGAVLLGQLFEELDISEMVVSVGALREGLLIDRFNRRSAPSSDGPHHLSNL